MLTPDMSTFFIPWKQSFCYTRHVNLTMSWLEIAPAFHILASNVVLCHMWEESPSLPRLQNIYLVKALLIKEHFKFKIKNRCKSKFM